MNGNPNNLPVLVAGGGIGGIAASLALVRRGFSVKVLEQAPQLGEIGAGLRSDRTVLPHSTRWASVSSPVRAPSTLTRW
jgi:2-polyprenyl-6-methoxyphenol hydroxylase-like FAD-dependent oxidoreductase